MKRAGLLTPLADPALPFELHRHFTHSLVFIPVGAALATGCVVGNIMSGVALMSVGNILFVIVVALSNWATTYAYMIGRSGFSATRHG